MIPFSHSHVSERSIELAVETLRSGWLSEGKVVEQFESELSSKLGVVNPVALNSETSALHLALVLCGVGPGDEVIVPPQTFIATGAVVLMCGAKPVFADIDPRTGNMNADTFKAKITDKTKAVIPVHHGGYPVDVDDINAIAHQNDIQVIEDAAHALGATYRTRQIGSMSRFTCFSFQAVKEVTSGDGGALCCVSKQDYERARLMRWFGIDRKNSKPSILGEREFNVAECGYKYHMNNLAAAVGMGNLSDFPARLARRQKIAEIYRTNLAGVPGIELMEAKPDRTHAYWFFSLLVDRRDDFIRKVAEAGVEASVVHQRIDKNTCFGGPYDLPGQAEFERRHIALPVHERVTWAAVEKVCTAIRKGW